MYICIYIYIYIYMCVYILFYRLIITLFFNVFKTSKYFCCGHFSLSHSKFIQKHEVIFKKKN